MINQDTTRAEKLSISIEETEQEITETQLLIQQLEEIKNDINDDDLKTDFYSIIQKCENKISYLEGLKENDEEVLNNLINLK